MKMLFVSLISLFPILLGAVPLESHALAKHPSIETLDRFNAQVGVLAEEVKKWNGNPNGMPSIIQRGKQAVSTLHLAVTQINEGGDIDYWNSGLGFAGVGLAISGKAHDFANAMMGKLPLFKAIQQAQPIFSVLDDAYTEATAFFTASKKVMPTIVYSLLKPFHTELLGTIGEAREAFRPSQEVVVVIVDGGPGNPPLTYTLPPGAPMPTVLPFRPGSPGAQYPQQPPYYPQYSPGPDQNRYSQYTPQVTFAPSQTKYAQSTPQFVQHSPQITAPTAPLPYEFEIQSSESPSPTAYAWFSST